MKILVICQHYYPEPFRISDICEELVLKGHQVTVVTGTPNYPMGEIYPGYEEGKQADEVRNGVVIHRCKTLPRKTGAINRLKNYFSYASQSKKYVKKLDGDFDVVFVNQLSPVMMAAAGIKYKKKYGKKLVLYCLDLWPESLCAGGIKKSSVIYKIFKRISKKIYRAADEILVTSKNFKGYLTENFGIADGKICYLPQYAEEQFLKIPEKTQTEQFNLLFAGNIGTAQSVKTIIECAKMLVDEKIVFHIVGDGIELDNLKKSAEGFSNVIFYGRKPIEDMPAYYEMADAMLVTFMDDPIISTVLPGKVQSYMASGRPIVGAINGETKTVLDECQGGYCAPAEDAVALKENILALINSGRATEIGRNNREYYLKNFSKQRFMTDLEKHLETFSVK